jgi:hypothetical protein
VNAHIREIGGRYARGREDWRLGFICICGCFATVELTIAEYDAAAGNVLAPGHDRSGGAAPIPEPA